MSIKNKKINKDGSDSSNNNNNNKLSLSKYLKAPVKMLIKARDFYIRSITECSNSVVFSSVGGVPMASINTMHRSYSTGNCSRSSGDEDFRELVRANSTKVLGNRIELGFQKRTQQQKVVIIGKNNKNMPRSNSSVIGRIDEDKPCCDFEEELKLKMKPRSKSYAVSRKHALVSAA